MKIQMDNFSIRIVDGNVCVVYNEGNFEYIKLVLDKEQLDEIKKEKEYYGY